MEDKITLDRESFRTLASKTRVQILKSLGRRRKMLTELSKQFGMSPSTIKEHMDNLAKADLVVQIDDGHKWKYYELTRKGREIVNPTGSRIFVVLGLSLIALVVTSFDLARSTLIPQLAARTFGGGAAPNMIEEAAKDSAEFMTQAPAAVPAALPFFHILGIAVFAALLGISIGYILSKRTNEPSWM